MPEETPPYNRFLKFLKEGKSEENQDSVLKIQPWQKLIMNPDAGVYPYEYTPKFSNYGFLEKSEEENNLIGGMGIGFPRKGINLDFLGIKPLEKNDYFKGVLEAGISKQLGDFNIGASVDTAITGYPDRSGNFIKDKTKLNPKLKLKYNFKNGGAMAPNIPTWDYPSKGTPIYRDTTDAPPRMFDNGGKTKDKRKAINQRIHDVSNYISNYEWNPDGTPVTYEQRLRDYYNSLADYFNNQKVVTTANKNKSLTDRRKYKKFIKNTMDDIYKISEEDYVYSNIPNQKYNIATGFVDKEFSPQEGFDDYIRTYNTADVTDNPTLLEKWKQRRNKAQMMNHVLAELQGYGELPKGYNDEDWANYVDAYEKAIANAKNYQAYKQAKKDVKGKGKGRYKGSDGTRKFLDDYKANNWAQFDNQNLKEDFKGQWQMAVDADTEEKRQDLSALNTMLYEGTMLGTAERVLAEPGRTVVDVNNTIGDLITAPFVEGDINPYSYNYDTGQRGVPYWEGAQGAMDATIVGSMAFPYLRGATAATSRTPGVTQAGFGRFRLRQPKATKVKVTPQQAKKLKKLNFTDDQIENFGTYFPEADSAFIDDFIKTEEAIKSTAAKAKKGTPTNTSEEIVNYNSSIDEVIPQKANPSENISLKEAIDEASEIGTYFKGIDDTEVQSLIVKQNKEDFIDDIIAAHPKENPEEIREAVYAIRKEDAKGNKLEFKNQEELDTHLELVQKYQEKYPFLDSKGWGMQTLGPVSDQTIAADFILKNPETYPRVQSYYTSPTAVKNSQDYIDVLNKVKVDQINQGKISLTPKQEMATQYFVRGYDNPINFQADNIVYSKLRNELNKTITQPGNQLKSPKIVTRGDKDFDIPELGKKYSELEVGDVFTQDKLISTSVGPDMKLYPYSNSFGNYTSSIKLPSGQSIFLPANWKAGRTYLAELEGILPQNLKFRLDKKNTPYERGIREVDDITTKKTFIKSSVDPRIKKYDVTTDNTFESILQLGAEEAGIIEGENLIKTPLPKSDIDAYGYYLQKNRLPFVKNKYFLKETPLYKGKQNLFSKAKSKINTKKYPLNKEQLETFLDSYNRFKNRYPDAPMYEFSILNPYKRGGYLNKKYKYGGFSR